MATMAGRTYAQQTEYQRKHGGGVGRGERSFLKLESVDRMMRRQLPILAKRGRGLIIDLNAGDGKETPHIQLDLFSPGSLISTPHLALVCGREFQADVWLCERSHATRQHLAAAAGSMARIVGNHNDLHDDMDLIARYPWVMVLSDPNGPSDQSNGVGIMAHISASNRFSDFVVVVNLQALARIRGVGLDPVPGDSPMVAGVRKIRDKYAWMESPDQWRIKLGKRHVMASDPIAQQGAMRSRVLLISNWIAGYGR